MFPVALALFTVIKPQICCCQHVSGGSPAFLFAPWEWKWQWEWEWEREREWVRLTFHFALHLYRAVVWGVVSVLLTLHYNKSGYGCLQDPTAQNPPKGMGNFNALSAAAGDEKGVVWLLSRILHLNGCTSPGDKFIQS